MPSPNHRAGLRDDHACIGQANEGNEQSHPARDGGEECARYGIHDQLAHTEDGENEKCETGQEYAPQRRLPRDTHALDHREREIRVQAHSRSERQRVIGHQSHENAAKCRGEAGRCRNAGAGHAGGPKNDGIDDDDVGHREERREAGQQLGANRRAMILQIKKTAQSRERHGGGADGTQALVHGCGTSIGVQENAQAFCTAQPVES